jgi:ribosomal protein S12 methylthiotransferase
MGAKDKVFLVSLGCAKNLVDSEHMLGLLHSKGFEQTANIEDAGIAVVNTCGFIQGAVEETIDTILEVANHKKEGGLKKLLVTGCFVQRYGYKLQKELPEVDGWLGTGEVHRIADILEDENQGESTPFLVGSPKYLADHLVPRVQTTPFYTAYLRIAEGCSHRCSYCTIPSLRGPFRSRAPDSLIIEAQNLISRGVKELNLIAQDTTMYGQDLESDASLEDLLERLAALKGVAWIRLLYCHPNGVSDRLLELIDSEEVICPYLDLPMQHVNQEILRTMGRGPGGERPWELVERIRSRKRKIGLRTTFIVGFPGETEKSFQELCEFVRLVQFDHLGAFVFSKEEGTSAAQLGSCVDQPEAQRRLDELMNIQREVSKKINQEIVGDTISVLIEGKSPETELLLKGRSATMAPDVDSQVLINKGEGVAGEIFPVLITEAHAYDLIGKIV